MSSTSFKSSSHGGDSGIWGRAGATGGYPSQSSSGIWNRAAATREQTAREQAAQNADNQDDILEAISRMIETLETVLEIQEELEMPVGPNDKPLSAFIKLTGTASVLGTRKPIQGLVARLQGDNMVLLVKSSDLLKGASLEVRVPIGKSGRGERQMLITGTISQASPGEGGIYSIMVKVTSQHAVLIPTGQKLWEFIKQGDVSGWNMWCADIDDTLDLSNLSLANSDLRGYDLCMANLYNCNLSDSDLSGADLSGSDLTGCRLLRTKLTGADLFRATIPADYKKIINQVAMVEVESIIFK